MKSTKSLLIYKTNVIFNEDVNHIMSFSRAYIQDRYQMRSLGLFTAAKSVIHPHLRNESSNWKFTKLEFVFASEYPQTSET